MTPERFQLIGEIFHLALEREPAERLSFITDACDGDDSLREEVESMIEAHERSGDFLNKPAFEVIDPDFANELTEPAAGQTIGRYNVLGSVGEGGMGKVYLALDTSLHKKIALKLLPSNFSHDDWRVRRFEQEARLASAADHPNICVIHEISKTEDGRHFIAMEYIDGITLRERIAKERMDLGDVLDVGIQIAAALEAAHATGVVHRDIKPENIMLRRDGYVKVLDFGIAKLNEDLSPTQTSIADAIFTRVHTEQGTRMGTVRYMSPEQLRQLPEEPTVDGRSDIWSLGVVLYEMVTGITPFEAPNGHEIEDLILDKHPAPLTFSAKVPAAFQQIVKKALNKQSQERYQTVGDLAADLKQLRQQIDREQWPPAARIADYVFSKIRERKMAAVLAGVIGIFAISIIVALVIRGLKPPDSSRQAQSAPFQNMKITPFTNSGKSVCAAISRDGKTIAHAEERDGKQELRLTSITNPASTSVVVSATDAEYIGVTFSPDNNYLYFARREPDETGILYQVAVSGGTPRKIKDGVDTPVSFSPEGNRFAYVRSNRTKREYSLVIVGADGTGERVIATRPDANTLVVGPAWSPDGKTIVCAPGSWANGYHANLVEFDVASGGEKTLTAQTWYAIFQVAWLPDKTGLIICGSEHAVSPIQLWRVAYATGESESITSGAANYESVSVSPDGTTIVSTQSHQLGQLSVAPDGDVKRVRAVASTVGAVYGLNWTAQAKIVLSSMRGNNLNISTIDADGSHQHQLTANAGDNYTPAASPDGRYIVFASNRGGSLNIWRINAEDASDPKQLTFSDGNSYPTVSPDSRWVLYDNQSQEKFTVWRVPIDGGTAVQLTNQNTRMPIVSPDGQFFACRYQVEGRAREIAIFPIEGGDPIERLPIPVMDWMRVQWGVDGNALTYVKSVKGTPNIWSYDLASRSSRRLTDFKTDETIFAYAWSADYKQLACHRGTNIRDVMIISQ